jgi:uncharacterized membrane protein YciS (DUF1049 family)
MIESIGDFLIGLSMGVLIGLLFALIIVTLDLMNLERKLKEAQVRGVKREDES